MTEEITGKVHLKVEYEGKTVYSVELALICYKCNKKIKSSEVCNIEYWTELASPALVHEVCPNDETN